MFAVLYSGPVGWHHDAWRQPPYADAALSMVGDFMGGNNHLIGAIWLKTSVYPRCVTLWNLHLPFGLKVRIADMFEE